MDEIKTEFRGKTLGYLSAALGLVAGLAWNDAISALIKQVFPLEQDTVLVKFLYALVVTLAVIVMLRYAEKLLKGESHGQ
jgi:hypothetical protein